MAMQRLKEAAEKAKIELSSTMKTNINLPFITADATGPKHLDVDLTRQKFDALTESLVKATLVPTQKALDDAGLSINDNSKKVDGFSFTQRLQLGGKMAINSDGSTKAAMKVVTNGPAKIIAYVISSSGSAERTFQAATLENGKYNVFYTEDGIQGKDAQRVEFAVDAAGTYYFGSASSGMNVYYVEVQPIN
jgi:hypothetical protein